MESISFEMVRVWGQTGGYRYPKSISQMCPFCGDLVTYTTAISYSDSSTSSIGMRASCPACSEFVSFWSVKSTATEENDGNPAEIFMYPRSRPELLVTNFPESVPVAIRRSFESAATSFMTKNYPATAVMARRTLEGIFKYLLPEGSRKGTLAALIKQAMEQHDLAAPLSTLAHAIRDGGNLGAHFDEENEPTELMAKQMVELLKYLISYLYVLPSQIKDLEDSLAKEPPL
ncbi:DUF4145 domain-containing protein [Pseudomonas chlororaphis]|uniref:DUF4145 domain-containing protein n=1 Tax=Pseudomonas chlororaphis TaxID=587753 RepID=UPI0013638F29|nr:DUF4145 domain-containing protein [Pseudomonas chlororaphis]